MAVMLCGWEGNRGPGGKWWQLFIIRSLAIANRPSLAVLLADANFYCKICYHGSVPIAKSKACYGFRLFIDDVCCSLVVSNSTIDCLGRLVSEITCYVSSGMLNSTNCSLLHLLSGLSKLFCYLSCSYILLIRPIYINECTFCTGIATNK